MPLLRRVQPVSSCSPRCRRGSSRAVASTRLTVTESGFAQLPEDLYRKAYDGNADGWAKELAELAAYLDAA